MKARKMLALVLALVITLGMMPGMAFAETIEDDYVAWTDSPNGTYSSLQAAIDAVDDGAIVYLNSPEGEENVTYLGTGVVIDKNVTIDLNGC
ncbi:MAG: hypothetical protein IJF28_04220, partial [Firmicutes bacterium]|nr:hypothetical protein [Bacillota bacterium]